MVYELPPKELPMMVRTALAATMTTLRRIVSTTSGLIFVALLLFSVAFFAFGMSGCYDEKEWYALTQIAHVAACAAPNSALVMFWDVVTITALLALPIAAIGVCVYARWVKGST